MSNGSIPPPPPRTDQHFDVSRVFRKQKSSFSFIPKLSKSPSVAKANHEGNESLNHPTTELLSSQPISLDESTSVKEADHYMDRYEWAVLYENQRGMTLFSVPYYSHLSLLPMDPSPFTIPNASHKRSKQPNVTLSQYPLPDGAWRWVSKTWMIDMRSDSGEVDPVGYEYNWSFRTHNWRANVGKLSAGGWVRRRRWIRLMMRPAMQRPNEDTSQGFDQDSMLISSPHRQSLPPSLYLFPEARMMVEQVWKGSDVDLIWDRLRVFMRELGRDGRKLEMWKEWLGDTNQTDRRRKEWTGDDDLSSSGPLLKSVTEELSFLPEIEVVIGVLRKHYKDVIDSFVFPDTRARFIELLGRTKALPELNLESALDFEVVGNITDM